MPQVAAKTGERLASDVAQLADLLRAGGFKVAVQQCVHATRLLVELHAIGKPPGDAGILAGYFGPIFCTNREQQASFPTLIRQWLDQLRPVDRENAPATPSRHTLPSSSGSRRLRTPSAVLSAVLIGIALVAGIAWHFLYPHTVQGSVFSGGTPVTGATILFSSITTRTDANGDFILAVRRRDLGKPASVEAPGQAPVEHVVRDFGPIQIEIGRAPDVSQGLRPGPVISADAGGVTVIRPTIFDPDTTRVRAVLPAPRRVQIWVAAAPLAPMAVFLVAWFALRRRSAAVFERQMSTQPPNLRDLPLPATSRHALPSLPIRPLARDLRRRRLVHSRELDIPRTLEATLRRAGWYTPVFGSFAESEYLVLIDRTSPRDHQARLVDELLHVLNDAGVGYERLYFDGDPSLCRRTPAKGHLMLAASVTLGEIAVRFAEHRLLIFTDGAPFFDAYTGEPAAWVKTLGRWPEKCVVTPNPVERWGRVEWAIERLGVTILPINPRGLRLLGEHFRDPRTSRLAPAGAESTEMPLHEIGQCRWTERHAPPSARINALIESLERTLGPHGFRWLAACAVYPEVHWRLTLHIGIRLIPEPRDRDRLLARLVRLVWFRQAYLPDWLRRALLTALSPQDREMLRNLIPAILDDPIGAQTTDDTLPAEDGGRVAIPTQGSKVPRGLRERFRAGLQRLIRRRESARKLSLAPADSPLRDYVFLRFISGNRLDVLAPTVPERLRRLFFPEGDPRLGPRAAALGFLGALAATGFIGWGLASSMFVEPGALVSLEIGGTNNTLVARYQDGTVAIWRSFDPTNASKAADRVLSLPSPVRSIALNPEATVVLLGTQDGRVLAGNLDARMPTGIAQQGTNHSATPITAIVSNHSLGIAAGSADGAIFLYPEVGSAGRTTFAPVPFDRQIRLPDSTIHAIRSLQASLEEEGTPWLIYGTEGGYGGAFAVEIARGQPYLTAADANEEWWLGPSGSGITSTAKFPTGRACAFARLDGEIWIMEFRSMYGGKPPEVGWVRTGTLRLLGHSTAVFSVRWSPDGRRLVSTGLDGQILLWGLQYSGANSAVQYVSRIARPVDSGRYYRAASFTADGLHIIAAASDGTLSVFDAPVEPGDRDAGTAQSTSEGPSVPDETEQRPRQVELK